VPGFLESFRSDRIDAVERFVRAMFKSKRPEGEIAELVRIATRMPLEASLSLFPSHLPREHWRSIARTVKAPLLYAVTPQFAQQASNLSAARAGTRVEIFMEAGHAIFVDDPGRFNRMLLEFIDESCRSGRD
jgi:microsomal epoxide hydrolase